MVISDLQKNYGDPYNGAYYEIKQTLVKNGFYWIQGSTYMTNTDDLSKLFKAIEALKKIDWCGELVQLYRPRQGRRITTHWGQIGSIYESQDNVQ